MFINYIGFKVDHRLLLFIAQIAVLLHFVVPLLEGEPRRCDPFTTNIIQCFCFLSFQHSFKLLQDEMKLRLKSIQQINTNLLWRNNAQEAYEIPEAEEVPVERIDFDNTYKFIPKWSSKNHSRVSKRYESMINMNNYITVKEPTKSQIMLNIYMIEDEDVEVLSVNEKNYLQ